MTSPTLQLEPEPLATVFPAGSYAARVVADGATAYWRLGEASGTVANDAIGVAHGTISGGVTLGQPGAVLGDGAMTFNGSTGKVVTASIAVTVPVTIEAWLRFDVDVVQRPVLSVSGGGTFLYIGVNTNTAFVFMNGGSSSGTNIRTGWHHVVYVLTPTSETFYVDGVLTVTTVGAAVVAPITGPVVLGFNAETGEYWNGSLDEVAIYPTALSAATIAAHYALRAYPLTGYPATVIQAGASHYWRLGESAGTTAVDIIGGANGTLSGGVTLGQPGGVSGDTAMAFNGSTGKIYTAAGAVTLPQSVTIEGWLKLTDVTNFRTMVSTRNLPVTAGGFFVGVDQTTGTLAVYSDAVAQGKGVRVVSDGQWHHAVCVFNGSTLLVYVDGVLDATRAYVRSALVGPALSLAGEDTGYVMLGSLDEVAIYPRALAASEVAAHYAAGTTLGPGDTTTLWRKWQDSNQAFNNEEHAALLNGFPPQDLTTQLSRFLWGSYASTQNPGAAHARYQNMVLADGASHFWRLSDTGTTAVDIAGGVSGTLSGGVTTGAAGAFSGDTAMTFDGVDDKVVTGSVVMPLTFTIEAWVKTGSATDQIILSTRGLSTGDFAVLYVGANGAMTLFAGGSVSSSQSVRNGQWRHVVAMIDGVRYRVYVDGVLDADVSSVARTVPGTGAAALAWDATFGQWWNGSLDNVAIYPRALSAAEVARHYAARG